MIAPMPLLLTLLLLPWAASANAQQEPLSFGRGGCGKLQGGVSLPCSGKNFHAFADTACALGRNYLHPLVHQTILDAYKALEPVAPLRTWMYGDQGRARGGPLWPHKTHQNGLSADFFVPVVDKQGAAAQVPVSAFNKFGYGVEFDKQGRFDGLVIDWPAVGAHLLALEAAGKARGVALERIILTPDFHEALFREVPALKRLAPLFMKKEAWVRHDEHYHVDFKLPGRLHRPLTCKK